jgi:hypothetical protein
MFDGVGAPIPGTLLEIRQADSQGPVRIRSRGGRTRATSRIIASMTERIIILFGVEPFLRATHL